MDRFLRRRRPIRRQAFIAPNQGEHSLLLRGNAKARMKEVFLGKHKYAVPMPKTVCGASLSGKRARYDACETVCGVGMGMANCHTKNINNHMYLDLVRQNLCGTTFVRFRDFTITNKSSIESKRK